MPDGSKFCPNCGAAVEYAPTTPSNTDSEVDAKEVSPKETITSESESSSEKYDFINSLPLWNTEFTSAFYADRNATPLFLVNVLISESGVYLDNKQLLDWNDTTLMEVDKGKVLLSKDKRIFVTKGGLMFREGHLQGCIVFDKCEIEEVTSKVNSLDAKHKAVLNFFEKNGYDLTYTDELSRPLNMRTKKKGQIINTSFFINTSSKEIIEHESVFHKLEDSVVYETEDEATYKNAKTLIRYLFLIPTKTAKRCLFSNVSYATQKDVCFFSAHNGEIMLNKGNDHYVIEQPTEFSIDYSAKSKGTYVSIEEDVEAFNGTFIFGGIMHKEKGAYLLLMYQSSIINELIAQDPKQQPKVQLYTDGGPISLVPSSEERKSISSGTICDFFYISRKDLEKICSTSSAKIGVMDVCEWDNKHEFFQDCRAFYNQYYNTDKYQAKIDEVENQVKEEAKKAKKEEDKNTALGCLFFAIIIIVLFKMCS